MRIKVQFYSYFKDLTGCAGVEQSLSEGASVADLLRELHQRFPKLQPMAKSTLVAVGVEYQNSSYRLREGEEVSLFPPVQGG